METSSFMTTAITNIVGYGALVGLSALGIFIAHWTLVLLKKFLYSGSVDSRQNDKYHQQEVLFWEAERLQRKGQEHTDGINSIGRKTGGSVPTATRRDHQA